MVDKKVDDFIEKGHKCMRGEEKFNLITEMQKILLSISYHYIEDNIKHPYFPVHRVFLENLQEKNIRIFNIDSHGELFIERQVMRDASFETIDVLKDESTNFIQLIKLDTPIVELVEISKVNDRMFFKSESKTKPISPYLTGTPSVPSPL